MAEIKGTSVIENSGVMKVTWAGLANTDTGDAALTAHFSDRTVQAVGDGVVAIQGSNDGVNWTVRTEPGGNDISLDATTFDLVMIRENPLYVRPVVTGGASTTVIVIGVYPR